MTVPPPCITASNTVSLLRKQKTPQDYQSHEILRESQDLPLRILFPTTMKSPSMVLQARPNCGLFKMRIRRIKKNSHLL